MTVPAFPTSTVTLAPELIDPGETARSVPDSEIEQPRTRSAATASEVSRARSGPRTTDGESLSAASTRARLVIDFEPGSRSRARTGPWAAGVRQRPESMARGYRLVPGGPLTPAGFGSGVFWL